MEPGDLGGVLAEAVQRVVDNAGDRVAAEGLLLEDLITIVSILKSGHLAALDRQPPQPLLIHQKLAVLHHDLLEGLELREALDHVEDLLVDLLGAGLQQSRESGHVEVGQFELELLGGAGGTCWTKCSICCW